MMRVGSRGFGMRKPCLVSVRKGRNEVLHRDGDAGAGAGTGTMTTMDRGPSVQFKGPRLLPAGRLQLFRYACWKNNAAAGHDRVLSS